MKTAIITQARMSSTRLPRKVMLPVNGKSLLQYHVERSKMSGYPVIVATSDLPEDDSIADFCRLHQLNVFRGNLNDVLSRYYHAAMKNNLDTVIRITSDCPLIDPELIKEGFELFLKTHADYVSNTLTRSYPRGFDLEIFSFTLLEKAFKEAVDLEAREHVTPFMWRNAKKEFKIEQLVYEVDKSNYRITVDTKEDFKLLQELITKYQAQKLNFKEIIALLDDHPELVAINRQVQHKKDGQYKK